MDVSIIIVSHNHARYLPACLSSLKIRCGELATEVLVIVNLPGDGSAQVAREYLPSAQVIENSAPRGFAANNNIGIRLSRGRYVLLLNPDTVVEENAIGKLVAFMDAHPKAGICGPQLCFPDGRIQPSCRRFPTWRSVLARRTPLRRLLWNSRLNARHLMADFDHDREQAVDWMLGACLMARRAAIDEVGMLDEGYTLYVEDIDWCYRMRQRGWDVYYVPSARVIHHHLAVSDRRWLTRQTVLHYQSMGRFVWKHYLRPRLTLSRTAHKVAGRTLSQLEGRH
jgi:GT2 family glycosyltransferase